MELIEIGMVLFWRDGVETNWPLLLDSRYVRKKKKKKRRGDACVCGLLAVADCFVQVFDFLSLAQALSVGLASN